MRVKKLVKIAVAVAVALHIADAKAASYQLNDYSVTNLGRSYAGVGVMGDDYSAIAYNPAGMTLMKRSGLQQTFNMINVKTKAEGMNGYAGRKGKMDFWQPVPAGFAQYNVNDKFFLGAGIYAPFGLKTKYKADWFGNEAAILSKLDIVDFNISAAYKMNQHWSVGASAILRYIYGRMTQKIPLNLPIPGYGVQPAGGGDLNFNVHGWSQTASLGVMYEYSKDTRLGVSYRLRSAQRAKGTFKTTNNQLDSLNRMDHVWANPDLPETVTISGYHRYKDVGFSGTARWTHWTSSFPNFTIYSDSPLFAPAGGEKNTDYKYKNTWTLSAGVDYYYCKNLTFRFGGGWDQSPTNGDKRRTIRIPDSDRWWMSVGASYMKNNWQFDVGYAHLIGKTAKSIEDDGMGGLTTPVHAKYKHTQSNILGVQIQYKF